VLVHGAAVDGRMWEPQLAALSDEFTVLAWDEPGAGRFWGVRRGAPWADVEAWGDALDIIQEIEHRDITARAKLAEERRTGPTFQEKLVRSATTRNGPGLTERERRQRLTAVSAARAN
jgi:hypothetical protein